MPTPLRADEGKWKHAQEQLQEKGQRLCVQNGKQRDQTWAGIGINWSDIRSGDFWAPALSPRTKWSQWP